MRKPVVLLAACVAATAIAAPAGSAPKTVTLTSKLKGSNEVPAADPDGRGKAVIRLNRTKETVCYVLTMKRIAGATSAHIHEGPAGIVGGPVVTLFSEPTDRHRLKACVEDVPEGVIDAIVASPKSHYVNVHNEDYPNGAIRGQLRKGKR